MRCLAPVILLVRFFTTAASSGGVERISDNSSGMRPADTNGFTIGELEAGRCSGGEKLVEGLLNKGGETEAELTPELESVAAGTAVEGVLNNGGDSEAELTPELDIVMGWLARGGGDCCVDRSVALSEFDADEDVDSGMADSDEDC